MRTRMTRRLAPSVAVIVLALGAAWSVAGARPAEEPPAPDAVVEQVGGFTVVSRSVDHRLAPGAAPIGIDADGSVVDPAADGLHQTTTISASDFEAEAFPPEGWTLFDENNGQTGDQSQNGWSRQICQTDPAAGGDAAAWSMGGGIQGAGMACGSAYNTAVSHWLTFNNLDTRPYPYGIQFRFNVWFDLPLGSRVLWVCWRVSGATNLTCGSFTMQPTTPQRRWVPVRPILFDTAGNQASIDAFLMFRDEAPSGTHAGVFVDNLVLEGLTEPPTATATATSGGPTVTNTPRPGETPPTPPPTAPRPVDAPRALLPMLMQSADKDDPSHFALVPTAPAEWIRVLFGTDVLGDGSVVDAGSRFPYGTTRLCAKTEWHGYADGTRIRWQWYQWNGSEFTELNVANLNGTATVGPGQQSWVPQCIRLANDAPIPVGERLRVAAFVNDAPTPNARADAEIVATGPITPATPRPSNTPFPTLPASPTPDVTPGTGPRCVQVVENGDFERGPSVGWRLQTNANQTDIARVIRRATDIDPNLRAAGGDWMALLGGGLEVVDQLFTPAIDLVDSADIVSATLAYSMGIITDETRDGTHDDVMAPFFVDQAGDGEQVPNSGISEENIPEGRWIPLEHDVTAEMTRRDGWQTARFMVQSENSAAAPSLHLLDEVALTVCVKAGAPLPRVHAGRLPAVRALDARVGAAVESRSRAAGRRAVVGDDPPRIEAGAEGVRAAR